jgi:hypothetical protein
MLHVSLAAVSSFGGFVTLVLRMRRAFPACGMIWPLLALVDTHCAQMSSIFLAEFGLRFLWYDVATSSVDRSSIHAEILETHVGLLTTSHGYLPVAELMSNPGASQRTP